jgi:hypothetical protein
VSVSLQDSIADKELAFGARPMQEIADEWHTLSDKMAPLYAKYGPNGTAKMEVEAEEARLDGMFRAMWAAEEKKATEAQIKAAIAGHPDIKGIVARQTVERAEYYRMEKRMEMLQMWAMRGQSMLKLAANEPKGGL